MKNLLYIMLAISMIAAVSCSDSEDCSIVAPYCNSKYNVTKCCEQESGDCRLTLVGADQINYKYKCNNNDCTAALTQMGIDHPDSAAPDYPMCNEFQI